ncbi:MAG TPA: hypothetical protein VF210_15085 [Pseudomonadales bacterium]
MQPWELMAAACAAVGMLALAGRWGLRAWSLRQLRVLARESLALQRGWAVISELPAELLTQPLRCTLGRIMYQRVKRARRVQPDHPFLRAQTLQIARFIGRTPRSDGRRLTGAAREQAIDALSELYRLLRDSAHERLITRDELARSEQNIEQTLTRLEFLHYRQAALQAEALRRTPQAIEYLHSALNAAQRFGQDSVERREVEARLRILEAAGQQAVGAL